MSKNKNKPIECVICGGETVRKFISKTLKRFGREFTYHNIRADVCLKCGERFFNGVTMVNIEKDITEKIESEKNK
jgi:YgiT-type zinc finger domain-containing protein